jgi:hypothetical protein
MLPKPSMSHLPSPSGTGAVPRGARQQTEGSVLCFLGSSRQAGPSQKADLGRREPVPGPSLGGPTGSKGADDMDTTSTAAANDTSLPQLPYDRYADIFSLAHRETKSIPTALKILDAYRTREQLPPEVDLPTRVIELASALFSVPVARFKEPGRHRDKTSARYVAAWILSRQHWTSRKIAEELGLEASTVRHGLAHVEKTDYLRAAACTAELRLLGLG